MQTFYEDWFMRQVRMMVTAIARIIFGKDAVAYTVTDPANKTETDELFLHLLALLKAGDISDAEDLLFEALNPDDQTPLLLALDFYQRLNAMSDEELELHHFPRREVLDGLREVQRIYGLIL